MISGQTRRSFLVKTGKFYTLFYRRRAFETVRVLPKTAEIYKKQQNNFGKLLIFSRLKIKFKTNLKCFHSLFCAFPLEA